LSIDIKNLKSVALRLLRGRALCSWDSNFRLPITDAKFMIKSSLLVLKFKDAGQAETEDWLCFWLMLVGQAPIA
jgi:hypothetical protein